MQFNTAGELIWTADGTRFPGYPVVYSGGPYIKADLSFMIWFGTKDGERRAYLTAHDTDLICDVEVVDGQLVITVTNVSVPGT